jgi:putative glutamine amidotransferase
MYNTKREYNRQMVKSKHFIIRLLPLLLLFFLFISCGVSAKNNNSSSDSDSAAPADKGESADQSTTISVYTEGTKENHAVTLTWKKVKGASYYTVERCKYPQKTEESFKKIRKSLKKPSCKDKIAKRNVTYIYRISAVKKKKTVLVGEVKITNKKPKALILDCSGRNDPYRVRDYLEKSGFSVKVVTDEVRVNQRKDAMVEDYDALVIPGGNSVNPSFYGKKKENSHSHFGKKENDRIQIEAVKKFSKAKKPVLGICRGCQLVNVAFGGTLTQCLGSSHSHLGGKYRKVKIQKNSWLYNRFGASLKTLHSHHQNVKKLGKGLYATQWDKKDGNVEAYQHESLPVYGLQWHPDSWKGRDGRKKTYRIGRAVLEEFRSVCQQWME